MTLDTRVYIHGPADHRDVFLKCNQLIGANEGTRWTDEQDETWSSENGREILPGNPWTISNEPDQGLPGWLMIHYRPGAALRPKAEGHDDDCDPDCDWQHKPACWLEISLDTAYSYHGPEGGCGDLHARVVAELGRWLDGKDIRWSWRNEFTGDIHWGYEGLSELGDGGLKALDWFTGSAAPVIRAMGAEIA